MKGRGGASIFVILLPWITLLGTGGGLASQQVRSLELRGRLVGEGTGQSIQGARVTLVDSTRVEWAAALTDETGAFVLQAPRPGRYQVVVERIGYQTWRSPWIAVGSRGRPTPDLELEIPLAPIELPELIASATSRCRTPAPERERAFTLYEEAREGLEAVRQAETRRDYLFQMRIVDERWGIRRRNLRLRADTLFRVTTRPIATLEPADLAASGYARMDPNAGARYYAPDAGVLLSDEFLATHCLSVTANGGRWIGLRFEPVQGREVADVAGVLWLDRSTRELKRLEYTYTRLREFLRRNVLPPLVADIYDRGRPDRRVSLYRVELGGPDCCGGSLEFERLPNGAWITRRWEIRTPHLSVTSMWTARPLEVEVWPRARVQAYRCEVIAVLSDGVEDSLPVPRPGRHALRMKRRDVDGDRAP